MTQQPVLPKYLHCELVCSLSDKQVQCTEPEDSFAWRWIKLKTGAGLFPLQAPPDCKVSEIKRKGCASWESLWSLQMDKPGCKRAGVLLNAGTCWKRVHAHHPHLMLPTLSCPQECLGWEHQSWLFTSLLTKFLHRFPYCPSEAEMNQSV